MVLDTVPADRMLIVETAHLAERGPEIARFVGARDVDLGRTHLHRGTAKAFDTASLDAAYVADSVDTICGETLRRIGVATR